MAVSTLPGPQLRDGSVTNAKVAAGAAIATSKLAEGADFLKRDGSVAMTADFNAGSNKLTNVAQGTSPTDAVNLQQAQDLLAGLSWKDDVRVATAAALPSNSRTGDVLTASSNGSINGTGIDGLTDLALNERVLVKNESTQANNGIYYVSAVGSGGAPWTLTRAADANSGNEIKGAALFVSEGSANAGKRYTCNTSGPITVNTTALTFVVFDGATAYTGEDGILVTGNVISPVYGTSADTICEGNDSRLSDARTPVGTALTSGRVWVGSSGNVAAAVDLSGDATISDTGAVTVSASTVVKVASEVWSESPSGTKNGSNVTFTLANTPISGTVRLYLNQGRLTGGSGNDYTISGSTITLDASLAPASGDNFLADYRK